MGLKEPVWSLGEPAWRFWGGGDGDTGHRRFSLCGSIGHRPLRGHCSKEKKKREDERKKREEEKKKKEVVKRR